MENNILLSRLKNAQGKFNPDIAAKEQNLIQMRNDQDRLFASVASAASASAASAASAANTSQYTPPNLQSKFQSNFQSSGRPATMYRSPANGSHQKIEFNLSKIEEDRKNELRTTVKPRHESTAEYEKRSTQFNELMSIIGQDLNSSSGLVKPIQKTSATVGTLYDMFMNS